MSEQKSQLSSRKLNIIGAALVIIIVVAVALSGSMRPKSEKVRDVERYLTSDLQGLAAAQLVSKVQTGKYAPDVGKLGKLPTIGVNNPEMQVTADGWSAVVTHKQVPGIRCGIGVGMRNPVNRFAKSGKVACKSD
jgi:hypothetical protein